MLLVRLKVFLLGLSLILYVFLFFFSKEEKKSLGFESIVYIIDASYSMVDENVQGKYGVVVSKFEKAKQVINKLSEDYYKANKKNGIIIFADKAFYYLPPTWDGLYFDKFLSGLNINFLHQNNFGKSSFSQAMSLLIKISTGAVVYLFSDFNNVVFDINNETLNKLISKQYRINFVDIDGKESYLPKSLLSKLNINYILLNQESIEINNVSNILSIESKYNKILKYIAALFSILGI